MGKAITKVKVIRYKKYLRADVWLDERLLDCVNGRQLGAKVFMLVFDLGKA